MHVKTLLSMLQPCVMVQDMTVIVYIETSWQHTLISHSCVKAIPNEAEDNASVTAHQTSFS